MVSLKQLATLCRWTFLVLGVAFGEPCERVRTVDANKETRSYLIMLPTSYCTDSGQLLGMPARPVLVALHGLGAPRGLFNPIFGPLVEEHNFFLVQPQGTGRPSSFNGVHCCGSAVKRGVDDVGFLRAVVEDLALWLPIDAAQGVVGTGFSNGAYLLEHAVGSSPSRIFSAISPVGGHLAGNVSRSSSGPVAVFLGHSLRDGSVKHAGCCSTSKCCCGISDNSPAVCTSVDGGAHSVFDQWLEANRCLGREESVVLRAAPSAALLHSSRKEVPPVAASCTRGIGCRAPTKLCSFENVGHSYPGRRPDQPFPDGANPRGVLSFLLASMCEASGSGSWAHGRCTCPQRKPNAGLFC